MTDPRRELEAAQKWQRGECARTQAHDALPGESCALNEWGAAVQRAGEEAVANVTIDAEMEGNDG